jgi:hypothetical protein
VAAEGGLIGLGLYLWLLTAALLAAFQRAGSSFSGRVQLFCALALAAIAVHSLFYASFFEDPVVWGLLAIVGAATAALPRDAGRLAVMGSELGRNEAEGDKQHGSGDDPHKHLPPLLNA